MDRLDITMIYKCVLKLVITLFISVGTQCVREKYGMLQVAQKHQNFLFFIQCVWGFLIDIKIISVLQISLTVEVSTNLKTKSLNL